MDITEHVCNSYMEDIMCQDGCCPDCNYREYIKWLESHLHCDTGSWDCPDENNCPHKKGGVSWVMNSD